MDRELTVVVRTFSDRLPIWIGMEGSLEELAEGDLEGELRKVPRRGRFVAERAEAEGYRDEVRGERQGGEKSFEPTYDQVVCGEANETKPKSAQLSSPSPPLPSRSTRTHDLIWIPSFEPRMQLHRDLKPRLPMNQHLVVSDVGKVASLVQALLTR